MRTNTKPEKRLPVASFVGVFGVHGALKCRPTSAGEGALDAGCELFLDAIGDRFLTVRRARRHQRYLLVDLVGIESVEAARGLVGTQVYLPREQIGLREGEFLDEDLIGLRVANEQGMELGRVGGVEHYAAQDCLVVEPGHRLVPLVRAFVRTIDLERQSIVVDLPLGLLDPDEAL